MKYYFLPLGRQKLFTHRFFLIMRLTFFFLCAAFLQISFAASAQKITSNAKNIPLARAIDIIESQTDYHFLYTKEMLADAQPVDMDFKAVPLIEVLNSIFKNQLLGFTINNNETIIITRKPITLISAIQRSSALQRRTITGSVLDTLKKPLPGVSVQFKGNTTSISTLTNANGKYSISIDEPKGQLTFSYLGFKKQTISITNQEVVDVVLKEDLQTLSDVVVIGYGTQKKADLTGAVSQINMDDILKSRPVDNIGSALQGALPGLNINSGSGQPGTDFNFNIRGFTSLNGGGPLILVDNVAIDNLNTLNPNDIETVTVLKDAGASAIYGARAAFGVVLITTKKGSTNQPFKFEYSANFAPSQLYNQPEKSSPLEFVNALLTFGQTTWWAGQDLATWKDLITQYNQDPSQFPTGLTNVNGTYYPLKYVDSYKSTFPGGFEQYHNFVATGGSDKIFFRSSVGYSDEDGPYSSSNDSYRKWNFNTSLTAQVAKSLSVQANVFYINAEQHKPDQGFYNLATYPSFSPQGTFTDPLTGEQILYRTPANTAIYEPYSVKRTGETRLSTQLVFTPIKKFSLTGEIAYDQPNYYNISNQESGNRYINPTNFSTELYHTTSNYSKNNYLQTHSTINLYAKYDIATSAGHNFDFLAGANRESYNQEYLSVSRNDLITSSVPSITTATGTIGGDDGYTAYAVQSLFGRVTYNYKNRYLFQANGRYDGSSRFAKGHQYGFFPSASVGWNIAQESFMQPLNKILPLLKLRASFGSVGNQNVSEYGYLPILNANNASWINPATGMRYVSINPPGLISANYTWETVQTANVGLDIGLLNNRLTGSFSYFNRKTLNMLVAGGQAPAILGTGFPRQNAANLETKGVEFDLGWQDKIGAVRYSVGLNVSNDNSYITDYNNNPGGLLNDYYVGQKLGSVWGYTTQGYFKESDFESGNINPDTQLPYPGTTTKLLPNIAPFKGERPNPGDTRYVDLNKDGVIDNGNNTLANHGDLTIIGNSNPKYRFGINGSASYKNFDFSFFLRGTGKAEGRLNDDSNVPYRNQYKDIYKNGLDFWTPTNQDAFYARIYANASGNTSKYSYQTQTKYLYNKAFLRIQNIGFGYAVPEKWAKKMALDKVRLFFSGENLFIFSKLPDGVDPEANDLGSGVQYPFLRKFSFGINVTL